MKLGYKIAKYFNTIQMALLFSSFNTEKKILTL